MRVLINLNEVIAVTVQDHTGRIHPEREDDARPYPFCVECGRQVTSLQAYHHRGGVVFVAGCHGEAAVVQFLCEEDGVLVARPVFGDTAQQREDLMQQLRSWMDTKKNGQN